MGTTNKRNNIIVKIIPGLLLILFSILLFVYYPKATNNSQVKETTTKYVPTISVDLKKTKHDSLFKNVKRNPKANRATQEKKIKKKINFKSSVPYKVKINRVENFVMIYGIDIHGKYKIPYKCFICSSAKNIKNTLLGDYRLNDRYRWHQMVDGSYAQYAIRFYDKLMLHSVPYFKQSPDSLEVDEYNKLGHSASLGCIRMRVSDIKWIYKHCNYGTEIKIYDKKGEKPPIPYEEPQRLDKKDTKSSWDPTDPNKKNPWKE
ncbi:MAG TPA: hypothetical protein DCR28_00140 [Eubacterium sp.]|nr:hypothetical protein [Eubacterium sp.]